MEMAAQCKFEDLGQGAKASIREKQLARKQAKRLAKKHAKAKKTGCTSATAEATSTCSVKHAGCIPGARASASAEGVAVGMAIEVHSLVGSPQHNGKMGTVLSYNADKGRYNVHLRDGEKIGIKQANIRPATHTYEAASYRTIISSEEYFAASPGGRFRDPSLAPTEANIRLLFTVLNSHSEQARLLSSCNYFQFSVSGSFNIQYGCCIAIRPDTFADHNHHHDRRSQGPEEALWSPKFNARLAWEGFFTITAKTGSDGQVEPLPELQVTYKLLSCLLHWTPLPPRFPSYLNSVLDGSRLP
eukprot:SAG31_NODE_2637_length_5336_cov_2.105977_9_plen_301_part_00